jgi:hypothetical protein
VSATPHLISDAELRKLRDDVAAHLAKAKLAAASAGRLLNRSSPLALLRALASAYLAAAHGNIAAVASLEAREGEAARRFEHYREVDIARDDEQRQADRENHVAASIKSVERLHELEKAQQSEWLDGLETKIHEAQGEPRED